ncbi:MAG: metallophosphoesterase [Microscillaceae bacterium]|nr:metallophosphoesterase [Microscillaceae bacterium]
MRIICLSDTHGQHRQVLVPPGDMLIHAGDFTRRGQAGEIADFNDWLGTLPHPHKVVVAGNHDWLFEQDPHQARALLTHAHYLEEEALVIGGLRLWGSPITPWFFDWAFNRFRGDDIRRHWEMIPSDTDILITHGPPFGQLDLTRHGQAVGCEALARELERIQPRLHVFGHIHEGYGSVQAGPTCFVNASVLDVQYVLVNAPWVVDSETWRAEAGS